MSTFDGAFGEILQGVLGDERMSALDEVFGRLHEMGQRPHYFRVDVFYHPTGKERRTDGQVAVIITDGVELLCGWPRGSHPEILDTLHWQRFEELRVRVEAELPRFLSLIGGATGDGNGDGYDRAAAAFEQVLEPIRNRYFSLREWGQTAMTDPTLADELDKLKLIWTA